MAKIFISYSRQSESLTKVLAQDIDDLGHVVWFDQELSGGQSWWDKILENIRDCDIFVMVLDPKALSSVACKREYTYASELHKPILPVLVSSEVSVNLLPAALSKIQMVDYRNRDTSAAFKLARALASIAAAGPLPDRLPEAPEDPLSSLAELARQVEAQANMNYEEQSALLFKLKKLFLDPSNTDDALKLLAAMRKRPDLLVSIADEIDELLSRKKKDDSHSGNKKLKKSHSDDDFTDDIVDDSNDLFDEDADMVNDPHILSLEKVIAGTWSVQISQMFSGMINASFIFSPNKTFSGQLFSNMGSIPVQGQWSVNMNMLYLNGFQTLAFVNYPYSAEITFNSIRNNRLEGTSQAGESIVMQK